MLLVSELTTHLLCLTHGVLTQYFAHSVMFHSTCSPRVMLQKDRSKIKTQTKILLSQYNCILGEVV